MRKLFLGILALILLLIPFHPFLATWLNAVFFDASTAPAMVISIWKEALVLLLAIIFVWEIIRGKIQLKLDCLDYLIIAFGVWSLVAGFLWTDGGLWQIALGVKYGLLFLVFFFIVRHFVFTKKEKEVIFSLALTSATIVIVFAVLQKFLPEDFLINFGYSMKHSFGSPAESLAYCQKISHTDLCRVQSTLSGPNQLGAYLVFILPLLFFSGVQLERGLLRTSYLFVFVMGIFALYWSYSRAAWLGFLVVAVLSMAIAFREKQWFRSISEIAALIGTFLMALAALLVLPESLSLGANYEFLFNALHSRLFYIILFLISSLILTIATWRKSSVASFFLAIFTFGVFNVFLLSRFRGEYFWQVILRPSSTQGHFERSADGVQFILDNPWGLGLGDAGPASNLFAENFLGFIPENWFLQVGLESGFLGMILFVLIIVLLIYKLFLSNRYYGSALAIGLIGLSVYSLLLHTWESSAVALSFWGLAGLALAPERETSLLQKIAGYFHSFVDFVRSKL